MKTEGRLGNLGWWNSWCGHGGCV